MSKSIVRCYGTKKRAVLLRDDDKPRTVSALIRQAIVHKEEPRKVDVCDLTWDDCANPNVSAMSTEDAEDAMVVRRTVLHAKNARYQLSKSDLRELEVMAKRRKTCRLKGKHAQISQQSEILLQICSDWAKSENVLVQNSSIQGISRFGKKNFIGDEKSCKKALESFRRGADCTEFDPSGNNSLHYMSTVHSQSGQEILKVFLMSGVDPNLPHLISGKGPLDMALEVGNVWAVRALLSAGALPLCRAECEGSCNLLEFAALHGFYQEVGKKLNDALFDGIRSSSHEKVSVMLCHGVEAEIKDEAGRSALAVCVEEGHGAKIARVLLEHGANPDGRDSADVPIAFYALLRQVDDKIQDREVFKLLANFGLNFNLAEPTTGETVWDNARDNGWNEDELRALFKRGG